jgi:hypothetical protein
MEMSPQTTKTDLGACIGTREFNDRYLDKQEMLQTFNISSRTLQNWRKYYNVTFIRIGNKTYYLKESLVKLLEDKTISAKINNEPEPIIQEESSTEMNRDFPADTIKSEQTDTWEQKSFARVWDPIPGYLVPIAILLIYFFPYVEDIINGKSISPFLLLMPLKVGITACAAYSLLQLGIWISKRITGKRKTP